jgi:hypothetical protein
MKIQCQSEEMIIALTLITLISNSCVDTTTAKPESRVAPLVGGASKSTEYGYLFRIISHYSVRLTEGSILLPITMPGNNFAKSYRQEPIIKSRGERRGEGAAIGYLRKWLKVFKYNELYTS